MRLVTWNINGLKAVVSKYGSTQRLLDSLEADIICFQETKLQRIELQRELALVEGWESFFSSCSLRTGYSGVATFCKKSVVSVPVAVEQGITGCHVVGCQTSYPSCSSSYSLGAVEAAMLQEDLGLSSDTLADLDREGRALITDHGLFLLVNLYGPALTSEEKLEERLAFKLNFYKVLEWRLRRWLAAGRAVLVVGDLNISPQPHDSCSPAPIAEFLARPDRAWLHSLLGPLGPGVVDVFRLIHPHRQQAYTCWNTASGARALNWGTRIDHILAAGPAPEVLLPAGRASSSHSIEALPSHDSTSSQLHAVKGLPCETHSSFDTQQRLTAVIRDCDIMTNHVGSDHAPVWADLDLPAHLFPSGHPAPAEASSRLFPGRQGSIKGWLHRRGPQQAEMTLQQVGQQLDQLVPCKPQQQQQQPQLSEPLHPRVAQAEQEDAAAKRVKLSSTRAIRRDGGGGSGGGRKGDSNRGQKNLMGYLSKGLQQADNLPGASNGEHSGRQQEHCCDQQQQQEQRPEPLGCLPLQHRAVSQQQQPQQQQLHVQQMQQSCAGDAMQVQQQQHPQHQQQQPDLQPWQAHAQPALDNKHQETVAAWQRISRAMQPPLCSGHKEPCVIRTVKKKGPNHGRQFHCCARSDGPPPAGRCDYFVWASGQRTVKGTAAAAAVQRGKK